MREKGFTLVEVLVALGILGVVTVAVVVLLGSTQSTWAEGSGQAILSAQLRRGMEEITRELVKCPVNQIQPDADGQWAETLLFRIPQDADGDGSVLDENGTVVEWSPWIRLLLDEETNELHQRVATGLEDPLFTTRILASRITGVEFRRQEKTPDIVEIRLTANTTLPNGRNISRATESRVCLRNEQATGGVGHGEDPPENF